MLRHVICVPVQGSPYLVGSCQIKSDTKTIQEYLGFKQKAVDGFIESCSREAIAVIQGGDLMDIVRAIIKNKTTQVYVNEEGMLILKPLNSSLRMNGGPIFGDVCVDVSDKVLKDLGVNISKFVTS